MSKVTWAEYLGCVPWALDLDAFIRWNSAGKIVDLKGSWKASLGHFVM